MDFKQYSLGLVLGLGILFIYRILRSRNKNDQSPLDFDQLLMGEDGRISKSACVMFGSFFLSSWVIINLTLNGRLTDVIFAAYMGAWVVPTVTKLIVNKGNTDDSNTVNKTV